MRKIIFVLLALLLTLAGCGKEALPETSSVPSEDTHITSPAEEKTEQSTVPSSEPAKTTEAPEETAVSKAESGTSDSSVKEPKQNTSSGGPTEPTEKTAPAENTSPTEPTETTPTVPNASASDAGAIAELVAQYLNDYRTAQGTAAVTRLSGLTGYAKPVIGLAAGICLLLNQGGTVSWVFIFTGIVFIAEGIMMLAECKK